jgi:hypothetical protein
MHPHPAIDAVRPISAVALVTLTTLPTVLAHAHGRWWVLASAGYCLRLRVSKPRLGVVAHGGGETTDATRAGEVTCA